MTADVWVNELDWLCLALSDLRPVLRVAALLRMEGAAWLVATDNYRVHALRLEDAPRLAPEPGEARLVDIARLRAEAEHLGATRVRLHEDGRATALLERGDVPMTTPIEPDWSLRGITLVMKYPSLAHELFAPEAPLDPSFAVNPRFLAEAGRLGGWNGLSGTEGPGIWVTMAGEPGKRRLVVRPNAPGDRWRAVVTPMERWEEAARV